MLIQFSFFCLSDNKESQESNACLVALQKTSCLNTCLYCLKILLSLFPAASFAINCGGAEQISASGVSFEDDSETLGAASLYTSSDHQWGVSSSGYFIFNPNGPQYIAQTDSQITGALESELYKTGRTSANSLRYYGLGLRNGKYSVELHFAEIKIEDSRSWKALGRRLFDVYIQVGSYCFTIL